METSQDPQPTDEIIDRHKNGNGNGKHNGNGVSYGGGFSDIPEIQDEFNGHADLEQLARHLVVDKQLKWVIYLLDTCI